MKNQIMDESQLPLWLSAYDVARLLGIGTTLAYDLLASKDCPSLKIGRRILTPKTQFLEFLDKKIKESQQ